MRVFFYHLFRSPRKLARVTHKRSKRRIRRDLLMVKTALEQEKEETREMLIVYRKFTQGDASKKEMKEANDQLFDIVKGLGIGVFAILPFAPITLPILIYIGKAFGVDVLPSAFYEKDADEKDSDKKSADEKGADEKNEKVNNAEKMGEEKKLK